jgi:hypothetical protein
MTEAEAIKQAFMEEEMARQVAFRLDGSRTYHIDLYSITFLDRFDDENSEEGYVGIIQGGYKDEMEDYLWDYAYYYVQDVEELKSLKIGESLTNDDWGILKTINYRKARTEVITITYEDIYENSK